MKIVNHEDKIVFVAENDFERDALKRIGPGQVRTSYSQAWDANDKTGDLEIHIPDRKPW